MQTPEEFAADLGRRLPHDWPAMITARDAEIAAEAARKERERCAKIAEKCMAFESPDCIMIADAIRHMVSA